ncbi:scaffolding protein [Streptomyces phage Sycamore]|uniref:Scaffolding protein n=1 Tax=Streptomyces phage Sycamore TaxID=2767589 RepID=A0A873WVG7_9CAUD|nr:scaffolding protein [Streptomyces phage Sycamore]
MPEKPEGEETPAVTSEASAEDTPQKPQEPAQEPVTEPVTKETTPEVPAPQKPAQGDDATAKAVADAAEAKAKAAQLELELNRERMARKHSIPDELMGMLRADSLEADAKALAAYVTARGSSLGTGGLDPTDNDDPKAEGEALADRLFTANRFF